MVRERGKTVLYIGGFELPDKNAAAHRVLSNAKILRELGWEVILIGVSKGNSAQKSILDSYEEVQGFATYHVPYPKGNREWFGYLTDAKNYIKICNHLKASVFLFYNFPSVAMANLMRYCRKNGIECYADVTEWYSADGESLLYSILKWCDTTYRMRFLHKRMDGVIAISRYLASYYAGVGNVVCLPPLTDCSEEKFSYAVRKSQVTLKLVYAGSPGRKDRIDYLVRALNRVQREYVLDVLGITLEEYIALHPSDREAVKVNGSIIFHGRIPHMQALEYIKAANYSCFFREENRVTKAGFPTKFVESVSCGTPVITNKSSNLEEYMKNNMNGILLHSLDEAQIANTIEQAGFTCETQNPLFDYHNYVAEMARLIRGRY